MADIVQPTEPTFATTYDFGTNQFGILKIVTDHQRDYFAFETSGSKDVYTRDYIVGSNKYSYSTATGQFTVDANGTFYKTTESNLIYHSASALYVREVPAKLRPVEMVFPDKRFFDTTRVWMRIGIAKEVLLAGAETYPTLRTFDGAFNLSNQTNASTDATTEQSFTAYEVPEDVNGGPITYARVNGLRTYLLTPLPLATDTATGVSFEIGMTNEGRIYDYSVEIIPSNRS